MQNNKKTVREILRALNSTSLQHEHKYSYNVLYEYKFVAFFNDVTVDRKVICFRLRTPVETVYCKNDLEVIEYLLGELEKFENGTIDHPIKVKKKKGRKPKNKELNQEVLTNEQD